MSEQIHFIMYEEFRCSSDARVKCRKSEEIGDTRPGLPCTHKTSVVALCQTASRRARARPPQPSLLSRESKRWALYRLLARWRLGFLLFERGYLAFSLLPIRPCASGATAVSIVPPSALRLFQAYVCTFGASYKGAERGLVYVCSIAKVNTVHRYII